MPDDGPAPPDDLPGGEVQATPGEPPDPPEAGAAPVRSARRKKLRNIADEALRGRGYMMVGDPLRARILATFTGHAVHADRGDAEVIAESLRRLARLFVTLTGARPQLFALDFGSSVVVEIGPTDDEVDRAARALENAGKEEDEKKRDRLLQGAVPETTLAALATRDLLIASEEDVVGAALSYGAQVTDAYKTFVRLLADEDVSLRLELPAEAEIADEEPTVVVLSSETAQAYKVALSAVGSDETLRVTAVGVLTMADSASHQVRLTLDSRAAKLPALKGRRAIVASYTLKAGASIRDLNLWDKEVRAEFEMTRDRRGTTAHVRPATFILVSAEPRYT